MGFGDLKTPAGLQVLNDYLADKSYIEGSVHLFLCHWQVRAITSRRGSI
uniref:Eukaryotic translation elongation factor 1 beta 2 n=1 Tax=Mus musculus TaxID=10090 RepID=M0QWH8_MOUSE